MQGARGCETNPEAPAKPIVDRRAGRGPVDFPIRISDERSQSSLCALERHGHAVSGKRRNHRQIIAQPDCIRCSYVWIERNRCDSGKRVVIKLGGAHALGERGQSASDEVFAQQERALSAKLPSTKKPAARS